jgi:hypothetical protein
MPIDQVLALLIAERDKLNRAIEALQPAPPPALFRGGCLTCGSIKSVLRFWNEEKELRH